MHNNKITIYYNKVLAIFQNVIPHKSDTDLVNTHNYRNYEDYLNHQKEKTLDPERIKKWQGEEWDIKLKNFKEIFTRNIHHVNCKKNAICLGSRTGQEVKALADMGIPSIGIDLVPFPPYTIEGDIHCLKYADEEFDLVFTNIFDHSLYPDKFCSEIERITKHNGIIIIHLLIGFQPDKYAENIVNNPKNVTDLFKKVKIIKSKEVKNTVDSFNWELVLEKLK